jgi:enoyl-[acyl-carrier-protein] reductase (NADH)
MFTNDSWIKYQEEAGRVVKTVEEYLKAKTNEQLLKNLTLPKEEWARVQMNRLNYMSNVCAVEIKKATKDLTRITTEGIEEAIKVSSKDFIELASNETQEILINETSRVQLEIGIQKQALKNNTTMNHLFHAAIEEFRATIPRVQLDSRDLKSTLVEAIRTNTDRGYVIYENGRQVQFKSWMEMSVRTDIQNNALANVESSAKALGVVAFIASEHFDCADDHRDYQGKFYLADNVFDEWNGKYMYLKTAKGDGFLTRPNCRHYVKPVLKEQLGEITAKDLGMQKGTYRSENYEALVEQRKNERNIRHYANRIDNTKLLMKNMPEDENLKSMLARDRALYKKWDSTQKDLIARTPLKRRRDRERPGVIIAFKAIQKRL